MKKTVTLKIAELKKLFFVRIALNEDHVVHLASLLEAGTELPDILVADDPDGQYDKAVVDGRHRIAAHELLGHVEMKCELRKFASYAEMVLVALKCNLGGALPPGASDISHTMELLLASGMKRRDIIAQTSETTGFPPRLVQKHLADVQSKLAKVRLKKAANSVTSEGMTVSEAAAHHGVKLEALKKLLQPEGELEKNGGCNVPQLKAFLSNRFGSMNKSGAHTLSRLSHDLKDGVAKPDDARDIIEHLGKIRDKQVAFFKNWEERLIAAAEIKEVAVKQPTARTKKDKRIGSSVLAKMGLS